MIGRRRYIAFCLGLLLALTSIPQAMARYHTHGAQTMVICTGYGLVQITLDADGNPVEYVAPCPDCVATVVAILPQGPTFGAADHPARAQAAAVFATIWHSTAAGHWHMSRAPPALV